jgi:hypothetical protein
MSKLGIAPGQLFKQLTDRIVRASGAISTGTASCSS